MTKNEKYFWSIRGWQLSMNYIKIVDIYVDGYYEKTFSANQSDFEARPDVFKVLKLM